jgi:Ca2+-binding EF-hand superfamily protein
VTDAEQFSSEFERIFEYLDKDHNGAVDRGDLDLAVNNVAAVFGLAEGSSKVRLLRDHYTTLWDNLAAAADTDKDGQLNREEFGKALLGVSTGDSLTNPSSSLSVEFAIADSDDDGSITKDEFVKLVQAFRPGTLDVEAAFARIDKDNDGSITFDEYTGTWGDAVAKAEEQANA